MEDRTVYLESEPCAETIERGFSSVRFWPLAAPRFRPVQLFSTPAIGESGPLVPERQRCRPGASAMPLIAAVGGIWAKLSATDP